MSAFAPSPASSKAPRAQPRNRRWLVYNLSPSFNWSAHGFSDDDLRNFVWDLGKAGFVLQLISLAGLHSAATMTGELEPSLHGVFTDLAPSVTSTAELASRFKDDGMLAYVELVQRKEKELQCDVLTHQRWSGALYVDRVLNGPCRLLVSGVPAAHVFLLAISAGSSATAASGSGSTEEQFH